VIAGKYIAIVQGMQVMLANRIGRLWKERLAGAEGLLAGAEQLGLVDTVWSRVERCRCRHF
jgi:hypothetical protein